MRRSRIVFAVVFSSNLAIFAGAPAGAAPVCLQAGEGQAFEIIGLKSTLMVDALTCGMDKNYDDFMVKFQPQVLDSQHLMDNFFVRAGGLAGAAMEDSFTTVLANNESDAAAKQGGAYCGTAAKQFAAVAGLGGTMDLLSYAVSLQLAAPPGGPGQCPAAPPASPLVVAKAAPFTMRPRLATHHAMQHLELAQKPPVAPAKPVPPYMVAQTI